MALLVSALLGFTSCVADGSFDREIKIRPGIGKFKHEILLRGNFVGIGNPHDLFDWSSKKWGSRYGIYTETRTGRVAASDLILTHRWGCIGDREKVRDLGGYIEFRNEGLEVALEEPRYDRKTDAVNGHLEFYGSGTYKIARVIDDEWKPRDSSEAESLKYDSCKPLVQ